MNSRRMPIIRQVTSSRPNTVDSSEDQELKSSDERMRKASGVDPGLQCAFIQAGRRGRRGLVAGAAWAMVSVLPPSATGRVASAPRRQPPGENTEEGGAPPLIGGAAGRHAA